MSTRTPFDRSDRHRHRNGRPGGLTVGVLGCGYWGSKHVRVLSADPDVDQVVAIDRSDEVLDALTARHAHIRATDSFSGVANELDAVVVATPPRTHAALASEALEAGCHVLVEKPLATSTIDAESLVGLAERNDLVLMSGHTFEYNPAVWKLRELVQEGALGEVYHIYTARLNLGLFQGDVNVLWDLAPHDISILNYVLCSRPTVVSAWAGALGHQPVEDVAYLRLHYTDIGLVAQVHVSWLDPCKVRRVTVVGSQKMAVYDDLADDERVKIFDKGVNPDLEPDGLSTGPAAYRRGGIECPYVEFQEPLAVEDRAFVSAALTGSAPPSDGRTGLAVVQILEAATSSFQSGQPVEITYSDLVERPMVLGRIGVGVNGHGPGGHQVVLEAQ